MLFLLKLLPPTRLAGGFSFRFAQHIKMHTKTGRYCSPSVFTPY